MSAKEQLSAVMDVLAKTVIDAEKFDRGNAQAGKRVRKAAQTCREALKNLRSTIQETKNQRSSA